MKIEKNIPAPIGISPAAERQRFTPKYPFRDMEPGDSVLVDGHSADRACKPYNAAMMYARRSGKTFMGRADLDQPGKVRIWRTE